MRNFLLFIVTALISWQSIAQSPNVRFDKEVNSSDITPYLNPAQTQSYSTIQRLVEIAHIDTTFDSAGTFSYYNYRMDSFKYYGINAAVSGYHNIFDSVFSYNNGLMAKAFQNVNSEGSRTFFQSLNLDPEYFIHQNEISYYSNNVTRKRERNTFQQFGYGQHHYIQEYDSLGKLLVDTFKTAFIGMYESSNFFRYYYYTYDDERLIQKKTIGGNFNLFSPSNFSITVKRFYASPTSSEILVDSLESVDSTEIPISITKKYTLYNYLEGILMENISYSNPDNFPIEKNTFEYDSYGNITNHTQYAPDENNPGFWIKNKEIISTYNDENKLINRVSLFRYATDIDSITLYDTSKIEYYDYNSFNNIITSKEVIFLQDYENKFLIYPSEIHHKIYTYETFEDPTSISAASAIEAKVYPNPATDYITIVVDKELDYKGCSINILDAQGRKVSQRYIEQPTTQMPLSSLNPGLYYVVIYGKDGTLRYRNQLLKQ